MKSIYISLIFSMFIPSLSWGLAPETEVFNPLKLAQGVVAKLKNELTQRQGEIPFFEEVEQRLYQHGYEKVTDRLDPLLYAIRSRDTSGYGQRFDAEVFRHKRDRSFPIVIFKIKEVKGKKYYRILPEYFFPIKAWGSLINRKGTKYSYHIYPNAPRRIEKSGPKGFGQKEVSLNFFRVNLVAILKSFGFKPSAIPEKFAVKTPDEYGELKNPEFRRSHALSAKHHLDRLITLFRQGEPTENLSFLTSVDQQNPVWEFPFMLVHELGHFLLFKISEEKREKFVRLLTEDIETKVYIESTFDDGKGGLDLALQNNGQGWETRSELFARFLGIFVEEDLAHTRTDISITDRYRKESQLKMPPQLIQFFISLDLFREDLLPEKKSGFSLALTPEDSI